ncbi:hypothetical protein HDU93_007915 [Gonapodya sp. JEL0774]|nr:hypothetical protein HDU93_007915 [Gonapodya sp. JEL0774]
MLLYLCSYLDRVNIGNAKVANSEIPGTSMEATLALTPDQYSWSVAIFFFGYVLFEVPSNILIVFPIGLGENPVGAVGTSRIETNLSQFFSLLVLWEQAARVAIFFSMASVAGAFSGLLASAISFLNGKGGLEGWRWIFILEGLPSVVVGVTVYFFLPNFPQTELKWLNDRERFIASNRLPPSAPSHLHKHFEAHELKETLLNPWTWLMNFAYFCCVCPLYSNLGFVSYIAQLMTVPPYVLAFFWTIGLGFNSDRTHERPLHVAASLAVGIVGFVMQLALDVNSNTGAKYFGVFLATIGPFGSIPCINTFRTKTMRGTATSGAVATAAMVASGNIGGIVSPFLYPNTAGPAYRYGTITNICLLALGIVSMLILRVVYKDVEEGIVVEEAVAAVQLATKKGPEESA